MLLGAAAVACRLMVEVRLRDFDAADVPAVHRWFNDGRVTASLVERRERFSEEEAHEWVARAMSPGADRKWAITIGDSDEAVGFVGLFGLDRHNGPEIGALIGDPDAWGMGVGREAERLAIVRAFEDYGVHRIHGEIPATNEAAKRVVQHLGFRREGVLRGAIRRGPDAIDNEIWGLLPEDFTGWQRERS
jgi:RimJ/RimL family protein N-acetyltransferase